MTKKFVTIFFAFALTMLLNVIPAFAQKGAQREGVLFPEPLEGMWKATVTFTQPADLGSVEVFFTFTSNKGKSDEGTLFDTNQFQFTPNPICTQDQGVWKKLSPLQYIATHYNYCFDQTTMPPGAPAGYTKIRDSITMNAGGTSFTIHQYIEGFDADGNMVFLGIADGTATKVVAEAPPASIMK